jgi:hypothetical protein
MMVYSVGKIGAIALSTIGYAMMILALVGFAGLFIHRNPQKAMSKGTKFLVTYLVALTLLAFALELVYNVTNMAGAAVSRLYVFSWLAMPVAAFASQTIVTVSKALQRIVMRIHGRITDRSFSTILKVTITVLVCLVNLSSINYYKAWSGSGIGLLESHYYVKFLTDQEYSALEYIRDNTPRESMVLTVYVDGSVLHLQATVSERMMISIRDLRDEAETLVSDQLVTYPDLRTANLSGVRMTFCTEDARPIYFISGIKKVSLDMAQSGMSTSLKKTAMESLLLDRIAQSAKYECVYSNNQVVVLRLLSIAIHN